MATKVFVSYADQDKELAENAKHELAAAANIAASYLSDIEHGKKPGSIKATKRIATTLNLTVDDLI